jgi:hypothetical protein
VPSIGIELFPSVLIRKTPLAAEVVGTASALEVSVAVFSQSSLGNSTN